MRSSRLSLATENVSGFRLLDLETLFQNNSQGSKQSKIKLKKNNSKKKQSKEKIEIGFVISNVSVPIKESKVILDFLPFLF